MIRKQICNFEKYKIKLNGSLVTIQNHDKWTNPLNPKSKQFSVYIFCCNLYLINAYVPIPTTDKCSQPFLVMHLVSWQLLQQKCTDMAYPSQYDNKLEEKKTLTTSTKLGVILLTESQQYFAASHYGIETIKMGFNYFQMFVTFQYRGLHNWTCTVLWSFKLGLNQTFILIAEIWNY